MAWSSPSTRSNGDLITAAIWNQDISANPIALNAGAMSITGQANGRFLVASSATQLTTSRSYVAVKREEFG